ncbi:MAG: nitrogen fixation protein FixH [Motiliproteus sp.]|jgi:nitrogen fixation protein FixH
MSKSSLWRSPVILVWGGLLLLFFIANGIFIYLALSSNPGLVVDDYYERGQDYEKHMLKRRAEDPGWNMRIELVALPVLDKPGPIRFHLSDRSGSLLVPDSVTLYAYRPANIDDDFEVSLAELQIGIYQAEVGFPRPGVWDLLMVVAKDGSEYSEALRVNVAKSSD